VNEVNKKLYLIFRDGSKQKEFHDRVNRIHKTITIYYKFRHIDILYNKNFTRPLALMLYNNISNFLLEETNTFLIDGLVRFIMKAKW
jgi:hypothetical protein